jgi:colanic acid/amylovoran biosynthesis glycosyltransferase
MAYGKPVIATGSYSNLVENGLNGYLFPEYDSEGMAERIVYLSEHPEVVERMRGANVRKARELFDGSPMPPGLRQCTTRS